MKVKILKQLANSNKIIHKIINNSTFKFKINKALQLPLSINLNCFFNIYLFYHLSEHYNSKESQISKRELVNINMNPKDLSGITKFNYVFPAIFILNWVGMLFGTHYFPVQYNNYCMIVFVFFTWRAIRLCFQNAIFLYRSLKVFSRIDQPGVGDELISNQKTKIYHAIIIPNYTEELEVLSETVQFLSEHKNARQNYLIFLAMQNRQIGSDEKAGILIQRFTSKFKLICFTSHELKQFQHKGKAANVSSCAQKMPTILQKLKIRKQQVFLTIIDADSLISQLYFQQINRHLRDNFDKKDSVLYQPPHIFKRNQTQVPVFVRTFDDMNSSYHLSYFVNLFGVSITLSNYSLSYNLLQKIGFYDTCEQAIAQDVHIMLKAFWKTNGQVETVPILVPNNAMNVSTGDGYFADMKARFWQCQRHSRVLNDVSYALNNIFRYSFNFKGFWAAMQQFQCHLPAFTMPWCCLSLLYQRYIFQGKIPDQAYQASTILVVVNLTNFVTFLSQLIYQYYKKRASETLFGIKYSNPLRMIQGSIFGAIHLFLFFAPSIAMACYKNIIKNEEFFVSSKKRSASKIKNKIN